MGKINIKRMLLPTTGFWNSDTSIVDRITVLNGGRLTDLGNGEYMIEPNPNNFSTTSMNFSIYTKRNIEKLRFQIRLENINGTSVTFDLRRLNDIPTRPNLLPGVYHNVTWNYTGAITSTTPLQFNVNNGSYGRITPNTRFYIRNIEEVL